MVAATVTTAAAAAVVTTVAAADNQLKRMHRRFSAVRSFFTTLFVPNFLMFAVF